MSYIEEGPGQSFEGTNLKISERFKSRYLDNLGRYLPQEIVQSGGFESAVLKSLEDLVALSSTETCEARIKGLSLACEPSDLAERVLQLGNGMEFIAGARFKNLNINFPFIEIQLGAEPSTVLLQEVGAIVKNEFGKLRPKGFKFKDRPNAFPNLESWSHTVFGRIEKREGLSAPLGMKLSLTRNLDWYPQYVSEYEDRLNEKKELIGFVRVAQLDEFQESAQEDALLVLSDASGFSGVIAGTDSPIYGLPAIYMIESFLSKRWTGKNVAPLAHSFFLNHLASRYDYVWGTIYDRNLSSLKTALRMGRGIIETEYFVPFQV